MTNELLEFRDAPILTIRHVENLFRDLALQMRRGTVPADAVEGLHEYYGQQFKSMSYFLHHFAPFIVHVDKTIGIKGNSYRLLDLGCGTGVQAYLFAARGAKLIGIDQNTTRTRAAVALRTWFEDRFQRSLDVTILDGNAFELLGREWDSFDGAYTQFALAYMHPQEELLKLLNSVVRPGGKIILQEFNSANLFNRFFARVNWFTFRDYRRVGNELNWTCEKEDFQWLFPRPVISLPGVRYPAGQLEKFLCSLPGSHLFSASTNLVYRRGA